MNKNIQNISMLIFSQTQIKVELNSIEPKPQFRTSTNIILLTLKF